mgnify:CR=1 FL=1
MVLRMLRSAAEQNRFRIAKVAVSTHFCNSGTPFPTEFNTPGSDRAAPLAYLAD